MSQKENRAKQMCERYIRTIGIMLVFMLLCTGCERREAVTARINTGKCVEIAMQYMRDKYQKDFMIYTIYTRLGYYTHQLYVTVGVKSDENEDTPDDVLVYPDDFSDNDGDGYIDCYHVVSDDYIPELVMPYVTKEIEEDLKNMGIRQFADVTAYMEQITGITGFSGLEADFPIPDGENISISKMAEAFENILVSVWISVPEGPDSVDIQQRIDNYYRPRIADGSMFFHVYIYPQEAYDIRFCGKEENGYSGSLRAKEDLAFSIRKEED